MKKMVMKKLEKNPEDIKDNSRYWKPTQIGQTLEGEIVEITEGEYNGKQLGDVLIIITPEGDEKETPAHRDLQEYIPQLMEGDKILIKLVELEEIEIRGEKKFKNIYEVQIDEDEQEELE
jgi:hypothetical protein